MIIEDWSHNVWLEIKHNLMNITFSGRFLQFLSMVYFLPTETEEFLY